MDTSDFVDVVDDNFLCTICHNVMVNPRTCSHGHQFCLDCISTWLQQSQTCPSRCGKLAVCNLTKLRMAEDMISKLQVRCLHAGVVAHDGPSPGPKNLRRRSRANEGSSAADPDSVAGCGWVGAVGDRERHLRDDCAYVEVECSCQGCATKIPRFQLAEHEASCEHREICCDKCAQRMKAGEMSDHLMGCNMVEIECPQECGARVLRKDLGEHEKECANVVTGCSYAEHGCEVRGKRKMIGEHEEEAAVAHARLVARRAGCQRERIERLETELAEKTNQVKKLEDELKGYKLEHGEVKVKWKIEQFTAKVKAKTDIFSRMFHVKTQAGIYHLKLKVEFVRAAESTSRGYVGIFVKHVTDEGGCPNFPICLKGTRFAVENGALMHAGPGEFEDDDQLDYGEAYGFVKFLSTDKIHGLTWKDEDRKAPSYIAKPNKDVTEFLVNNTLVVSATVRITPPEEIEV